MQKDPVRLTLEELGLNDKEIAIYLMVLQLGTATASALGDRTDIIRSTAQYCCQQLTKKGLLRMVQKGNTYLFSAEDPRKLLSLLERQRRQLDQKEEGVHRIISTLSAMMQPSSALPKVRFFEGIVGLTNAYDEIADDLSEGGEILSYIRPIDMEDLGSFSLLISDFVQKRVRKNVHIRLIAPASETGRALQSNDGAMLRETRLIPVDRFDFSPVEVMIYNDKMYSMAVQGPTFFAYIVQSQNVTKLHRSIFEIAWQAVGKSM